MSCDAGSARRQSFFCLLLLFVYLCFSLAFLFSLIIMFYVYHYFNVLLRFTPQEAVHDAGARGRRGAGGARRGRGLGFMYIIYTYVCMNVCMYLSIYLCMHVCMYVYTCIYTYIYIYIEREREIDT